MPRRIFVSALVCSYPKVARRGALDACVDVNRLGLGRLSKYGLTLDAQSNDSAILRTQDGSEVLRIELENEKCTVTVGRWHTHVQQKDVTKLLFRLLCGEVAMVCQYRDDTLTASWTEFERSTVRCSSAQYLNPFDMQDWDSWPGEQWIIERTRFNILSRIGWTFKRKQASNIKSSTTEIAEETYRGSDWTHSLLKEILGDHPEGCRWTSRSGNDFAFLMPDGWRTVKNEPADYCEYGGYKDNRTIFVGIWYRTAETGNAPTRDPVPPDTITHTTEDSIDGLDWTRDTWNCVFTNGNTQMMAVVIVQRPNDENFPNDLSKFFSDTLPMARFLTPNG